MLQNDSKQNIISWKQKPDDSANTHISADWKTLKIVFMTILSCEEEKYKKLLVGFVKWQVIIGTG